MVSVIAVIVQVARALSDQNDQSPDWLRGLLT
jgi:hypothetical protein